MKHYIKTAVILLALYAQAVSADQQELLILKSQQNLTQATTHSVKPSWTLASNETGMLLVGFASFTRIQQFDISNPIHTQGWGLGLYQQHTPWLHSQLLVQQHPLAPNQVQSLMEWVVGF